MLLERLHRRGGSLSESLPAAGSYESRLSEGGPEEGGRLWRGSAATSSCCSRLSGEDGALSGAFSGTARGLLSPAGAFQGRWES